MNRPLPIAPQPPAEGPGASGPALGDPGQRRRLWQLPATAHDLLLALSLPAAERRRLLQQALRRAHGRPCEVRGSDADVLYATAHDLGQRNVVSEALQTALQQAHTQAVARMAAVRGREALLAAWQQGLQAGDVASTLWAVLTHRWGAEVQEPVLFDARAWALEQARQTAESRRAQQGAEQRALQAQQGLHELQARVAQDKSAQAVQWAALQAELSRLRGTVAGLQNDIQRSARPAEATPPVAASAPLPAKSPGTRPAQAIAPAQMQDPVHPPVAPPVAPPATLPAHLPSAPVAMPGAAPAPRVEGRRVLCVGGMRGAQARYKRLIEDAGGQFAFHDGGVEDGVHRLAPQLHAADVVVCQAGCLNHEAYHRVKALCRRLDKPCVFLDRPSLSGFARGLGLGRPAPAAAAAAV